MTKAKAKPGTKRAAPKGKGTPKGTARVGAGKGKGEAKGTKAAAKPKAKAKTTRTSKAKTAGPSKSRAKTAAPSKSKSRAKTAATVTPRAKTAATATPRAKSAKPRNVQAPAAAEESAELMPVEAPVESAVPHAKKGPLARLADGVGNLFARVTGKKAAEADPVPEVDDASRPSPDQTIELATDDILAETAEPPPTPKQR